MSKQRDLEGARRKVASSGAARPPRLFRFDLYGPVGSLCLALASRKRRVTARTGTRGALDETAVVA